MSTNINMGKTLIEKGYFLVPLKESFCEHFNHLEQDHDDIFSLYALITLIFLGKKYHFLGTSFHIM